MLLGGESLSGAEKSELIELDGKVASIELELERAVKVNLSSSDVGAAENERNCQSSHFSADIVEKMIILIARLRSLLVFLSYHFPMLSFACAPL